MDSKSLSLRWTSTTGGTSALGWGVPRFFSLRRICHSWARAFAVALSTVLGVLRYCSAGCSDFTHLDKALVFADAVASLASALALALVSLRGVLWVAEGASVLACTAFDFARSTFELTRASLLISRTIGQAY